MTEANTLKVREYLVSRGLTFEPLLEEMVDHIMSDIQELLSEGNSFEQAMNIVTNDLPENHFTTIQIQTMESINKRFNLSRFSSYLALGLLTITSVFKLLHLPGTTMLLFLSFFAIGISLVVGGLSGILLHKEKKGVWIVASMLSAILIFLLSWVFTTLQFPGALATRILAIASLSILFPMMTLYASRNITSENNLLIFLHEKHASGIERFLLVLLGLAVVLKIAAISVGYPPNVSWVLLVLTICGAGLHFFALTWHPNSHNSFSRESWQTVLLIIAFICSILPALGPVIPAPARAIMAGSFYLIAGFIAISRLNASHYTPASLAISIIIVVFYVMWMLINLNIITSDFESLIFNLPMLLVHVTGLALSQKHTLLRMFMVMVVAHFLFEFPLELSFI